MVLRSRGQREEELTIYSEIIRLFSDVPSVGVRVLVAKAFVMKATALVDLKRAREAQALLSDTAQRIERESEQSVRDQFTSAMQILGALAADAAT